MGNKLRRAVLLAALNLVGLTGCQNLASVSGLSGSAPTMTGLAPMTSSEPLDGTGPSQTLELPTRQKVEVCLATAKQMEAKGSVDEAIAYYEQIRQLDPHRNLLCARHLAVLYDRKGNFDRALDEYGQLLKANPDDGDAHNDLGYGYYSRGQFEAAEKSLRKAVECNAKSKHGWTNFGMTAASKDSLDAKGKRAWTNLGMTLAQLGKYEESLAAFEKVVSKPQALCNVGFIQAAQGKWTEARDSYASAVRLEPGLQKARAALERMNEGPRSKKDRERMDASRRHREMLENVEGTSTRGLPFGMPPGITNAEADMVSQIIDLPSDGGRGAVATSTSLPTPPALPTPPMTPPPSAPFSLPSLPAAPAAPAELPPLPATPLAVD